MEMLMDINAQNLIGNLKHKMRGISFRCPTREMHTQAWIADDFQAGSENEYLTVDCIACRGIHLINPRTAEVIGARTDSRSGST
jgi:hypothetical protein